MDNITFVSSNLNMPTQTDTNITGISPVKTELRREKQISQPELVPGMIIADDYIIIRKLDKKSGEADLYLAENKGTLYAVKVYRREDAVKEEITNILSNINHPNLPHLFATGIIDDRQFEVMEYYSQGSLEGTTISEQELKEHFLPDMNEAIHMLDTLGIVHKDIKPSNIAKKADGKYVLMDFGISSVRKDGRTDEVTDVGQTFCYSAPENMGLGAFWSTWSDYYSLGITVYELLVGALPFAGMNVEEKVDYKRRQVIPIPDSISEDVRTLILGMTYKDIGNRGDLSKANSRWGYEFICDWISGKVRNNG